MAGSDTTTVAAGFSLNIGGGSDKFFYGGRTINNQGTVNWTDGGNIRARPVTPGDLAATIYHHLEVPLTTTYQDSSGRPRFVLEFGGVPIRELV